MSEREPGLVEQALNKVVEDGLSAQVQHVEELQVHVETDPLQLLGGGVETVSVHSRGLVVNEDLRVQEMELHTESVAVNPLSALFGKIELRQSTDISSRVVMTEQDINRLLDSPYIRGNLQDLHVQASGQSTGAAVQQMELFLPESGNLVLDLHLRLQSGQTERFVLTITPCGGRDGTVQLGGIHIKLGAVSLRVCGFEVSEEKLTILTEIGFDPSKQDLRVPDPRMTIHTGSLILGSLEIVRPTDATARIVLNAEDISHFLNSQYVRGSLQNLKVHLDGQAVSADVEQIAFSLSGDGIAIDADVLLRELSRHERLSLRITPRTGKLGMCLEDIQFELPGLSLHLRGLEVEKGKLTAWTTVYARPDK